MNRKQFILTQVKSDFPHFKRQKSIGDYNLHTGKDLEYEFVKTQKREFHLLGSVYDWNRPKYSNKQNLENISKNKNISETLEYCNKYCGAFILIIKFDKSIYIFNDACGQKEVYYDDKFICFASQPKLIGLSIKLEEHTDDEAIKFYKSKIFNQKCIYVGNTTHKKNVFHLLPNHFLSISKNKVERFFPSEYKKEESLESIVEKSSDMLKGYIKAISQRDKIKMAVTGGYDSRVLFLASLDIKCNYYVSKHHNMEDSHYDIVIPKKLTKLFEKDFSVEIDSKEILSKKDTDYINDIDFPRFLQKEPNATNFTFLNGNISEIARNYYGYLKNATAEDLCYLAGYSKLNFAVKQYSSWLKDKKIFSKNGYHYLDMFYWEEKMGNWAAKAKTESQALGKDIITPFNSRSLLNVLLGSKRTYRDSHFNRLYDLMIAKLSDNNKDVIKTPINPSKKQYIIKLMKVFKIYNLYRYIIIKGKL